MGEQLRTALAEMGHQQPPTPICTDNSTADGIINKKLKQCWSCAIDMHFYWPGKYDMGNYITKNHPPGHHK
eukprot:7139809-Ditylum_brightwellii.AAC.1